MVKMNFWFVCRFFNTYSPSCHVYKAACGIGCKHNFGRVKLCKRCSDFKDGSGGNGEERTQELKGK